MRQYFAIIVTVALVVVVLVAINAASYVEIEQEPDSEYNPDRSTYNARATGTRALFDYLQESGHKVVRWREQPEKLLSAGTARPGTFVVAGPTRIPFEPEEIESLLEWVERGGRLVIVDRAPDQRLLPASGNWRVSLELQNYPTPDARSSNADEMTAGVPLARAAQPTSLTVGVDSVLASRFASAIKIFVDEGKTHGGPGHANDAEENDYNLSAKRSRTGAWQKPPPPPPPVVVQQPSASAISPPPSETTATQTSPAPVIHLIDSRGTLLADYKYGDGRIIILSDPFIIANSGINRADNLRLAVNVVAGASDLIAFDEYHHGRAVTHNQILSYFAGTPVLAMLGQIGLIVLVVVWSSGSRFARALPLPFVDRRSKLEFVASMAELQQRTRAYDLAIENIYARTRRVLARYAGLDSNSPRALIAERVAARSTVNAQELETIMRECEDAIAGEPLSARQALNLVARLREVERTLGLRMRSREIKQAKER
ncbi:MAG TPA: DUF4350 domain-containing protein [Pyrinomonadaceae bacterium]|nr:DUF4350 domain-containing protein [Pyrinomonadaceae bacterium]